MVGYDNKVSEIVVFDLLENKMIDLIENIKQEVYQACFVGNFIVFTTDSAVFEYKIQDFKPHKPFNDQSAKSKIKICVNRKESLMFCAGNNGVVDVVILNSQKSSVFQGIQSILHVKNENSELSLLKTLDFIQAIALNSSETFLLISVLHEGVQFWNLEDQMPVFTYKVAFPISGIITKKSLLYLKSTNEVLIIKDPSFTNETFEVSDQKQEKVFILGPNQSYFYFLGVFLHIFKNSTENDKIIKIEYEKSIHDWIIFPYCLYILHVFTYLQSSRLVKKAF